MKGNPIPTAVRTAVDERDRRQCLRCGLRSRAQHHRIRRRDGGHPLSVVISLCNACHSWAHANPTEAKAGGFIVPPWGDDPETVPLKSYMGWISLKDDGTVHFVNPPEATTP